MSSDITSAFTDEHFRQYILEQFCNDRGYIQEQDVCEVHTLELPKVGIRSLDGIEYFRELNVLDCSYNALTGLNMKHNLRLTTLLCRENQLLELQLQSNEELEVLDCSFNRLRKLDLSQNNKLESLECHWNQLSKIDTTSLRQLQRLACSYNTLFSLDVTSNNQLVHLDCANNDLMQLDVTGCPVLLELRCHHNHLKSLDLSGNPLLESLRCFNNHIRELDLRHNPELAELYCSENKLKSLDVSHNGKLENIQYGDNLIVEPDHEVQGMGTFHYDNEMTLYYMDWQEEGRELRVTAEIKTKSSMEALCPYIEAAWEQWPELRERALHVIGKANPDEDVSELVFADAVFQVDGSLRLGFDAGETPGGQLYIYVEFDEQLELSDELIYEMY
nr:leucine-rich repeat domain-containing protein [Paenibacillus xylanexedens]